MVKFLRKIAINVAKISWEWKHEETKCSNVSIFGIIFLPLPKFSDFNFNVLVGYKKGVLLALYVGFGAME